MLIYINMKKSQKTFRQAQGAERSRSITKDMAISEAARKYPRTAFVFMDYGLHCIGCPAAPDESIEEAAKVHRIDLDRLLKDLNEAALRG